MYTPWHGVLMQPQTIESTLHLYTRYTLQLGSPRQYETQSFPGTRTQPVVGIELQTFSAVGTTGNMF